MKIIEYNNFKVQPLAGALGAEILDIDLNKINDSIFEEIYKAFVDYQVIGIPNQNLSPDEYLAFGRRWGEIHHYPYMKGLESHPEILEISKGVSDETLALRELLNQAIDEMELSVRSFNCLQAAGIKYIHELVSKEENQMLKYKNFGRKSLTELVDKLSSMGLHFGMDISKIMAEEG